MVHRFCDICGDKVQTIKRCEICSKDLCSSCVGHVHEDWSDYYDYYCKRCWEIGQEFRDLIAIHESEIEGLHQEWINKCIL